MIQGCDNLHMSARDDANWMHAKYAHIRIPKAILNSKNFPLLSPEAILLYGAMMDRTSLSIQFGGKRFLSPTNEVTIIFSQKEMMKILRCKRDKARSVTQQLVNSKLITLSRKSRCGPYRITVIPQNWSAFDQKQKNVDAPQLPLTSYNPSIDDGKINNSRDGKININNTDSNNTESNNTSAQLPNIFNLCELDALVDTYGPSLVNRVSDLIIDLFSDPPEKFCILGKEMDWHSLSSLFHSFTKTDYEFVLKKMKKARYTEEYSDAFILEALYSASIMHATKKIKRRTP